MHAPHPAPGAAQPRSCAAPAAFARRVLAALAALAWASLCDVASAQDSLTPSSVFLQFGTATNTTHEAAVGLTWDWRRHWGFGSGRLGGYWEGSISQWSYPAMDERSTATLSQVGVIPVFRYRPDDGGSPWFAEAGVGLTLTTTLYETDQKKFSSSFNFGDHLAVGRNFGNARTQEVALRVEHFSNAGIKRPNPGENFLQLRYAYRFR